MPDTAHTHSRSCACVCTPSIDLDLAPCAIRLPSAARFRRPPLPSSVSIPVSMWCGSLSTSFASDVMRDRQPALSHGLLGSALLFSFRMSSSIISRGLPIPSPGPYHYGSISSWHRFSVLHLALTGFSLVCRLGTNKMGSLIRTPTEQEFDDLLSFVFSFALLCLDCDATNERSLLSASLIPASSALTFRSSSSHFDIQPPLPLLLLSPGCPAASRLTTVPSISTQL
ncbi:hypothetical protein B0H13DRAFT_2394939 [Mycena leptocephala]|nr:hypothetical protein B0H13DRAFT_2394939 [Mycena leptocephala]